MAPPRGQVIETGCSGEFAAKIMGSTSLDVRIGELADTDICSVPFNSGACGPATSLAGAAEKGTAEYHPNDSGDDQFVAFNRVLTSWAFAIP